METTITKSAIETVLFAYQDALNASDVQAIMALYQEDGVFMPSGALTAVGTASVKAAYEFVFKNIQLSIEFHIDEVVDCGEYAFARTMSKGTMLIHATGQQVPEENRELFVLQQVEGNWKIARYIFNKIQ